MNILRSVSVASLLAVSFACASSSGSFVWVWEYTPPPPAEDPRAIGVGDTLDVRVLAQEQLSTQTRVRSDGFITLPFLSDVKAVGILPSDLGSQIEELLKDYVRSPMVTVGVEKAAPPPLSVLGEVGRPGTYDWAPDMGVLDLLAKVGGLTEFAHQDRLYVLRGRPEPTRIRFDVKRLMQGQGSGLAFTLEPGDVIVAE